MPISGSFTQARYVLPAPSAKVLASKRASHAPPLQLSSSALSALNEVLDEVLYRVVALALSSLASPILDRQEVLAIERFRTALVRIVGSTLGTSIVEEAEAALRALLRAGPPSLKVDPALKQAASTGPIPPSDNSVSAATAALQDELFRALRVTVQASSALGIGCPPQGPAALRDHVQLLLPPPPPPSSVHLTFVLAFYAERCLTALARHLLTSFARASEASGGVIGAAGVEEGLRSDDSVWAWAKHLRAVTVVQRDADLERRELARAGAGTPASATGSSSTGGRGAKSSFDLSRKRDRSYQSGLGIDGGDEFDQLVQSNGTRKVTLTPNRIRTLETRRGMINSSSLPAINAERDDPGAVHPASAPRRLVARAPRPHMMYESDDDDAEELGAAHHTSSAQDVRSSEPRESLMELLNTPPPWSQPKFATAGVESPTPAGPSRLDSEHPPSTYTTPLEAYSQTFISDDEVDDFDEVPPSVSSDGTRRKLRPKDERDDIGIERSINYDLADFFANAPPPVPLPPTPTSQGSPVPESSPQPQEKGSKKSSALRGLVSRVKRPSTRSEHSDNSEDATPRKISSGGRRMSLLSRSVPASDPSVASSSTTESQRPSNTRQMSDELSRSHGHLSTRVARIENPPNKSSPPLPPLPSSHSSSKLSSYPSSSGADSPVRRTSRKAVPLLRNIGTSGTAPISYSSSSAASATSSSAALLDDFPTARDPAIAIPSSVSQTTSKEVLLSQHPAATGEAHLPLGPPTALSPPLPSVRSPRTNPSSAMEPPPKSPARSPHNAHSPESMYNDETIGRNDWRRPSVAPSMLTMRSARRVSGYGMDDEPVPLVPPITYPYPYATQSTLSHVTETSTPEVPSKPTLSPLTPRSAGFSDGTPASPQPPQTSEVAVQTENRLSTESAPVESANAPYDVSAEVSPVSLHALRANMTKSTSIEGCLDLLDVFIAARVPVPDDEGPEEDDEAASQVGNEDSQRRSMSGAPDLPPVSYSAPVAHSGPNLHKGIAVPSENQVATESDVETASGLSSTGLETADEGSPEPVTPPPPKPVEVADFTSPGSDVVSSVTEETNVTPKGDDKPLMPRLLVDSDEETDDWSAPVEEDDEEELDTEELRPATSIGPSDRTASRNSFYKVPVLPGHFTDN